MIDLCSTATVVQCFFLCMLLSIQICHFPSEKPQNKKGIFMIFLLGFFNFFPSFILLFRNFTFIFLPSSFIFGLLFGYQIKLFMQNIIFLFNHKFLISTKRNREKYFKYMWNIDETLII